MSAALMELCLHDLSLTGTEGPVSNLGRMPILWSCDGCGAVLLDSLADREIGGEDRG